MKRVIRRRRWLFAAWLAAAWMPGGYALFAWLQVRYPQHPPVSPAFAAAVTRLAGQFQWLLPPATVLMVVGGLRVRMDVCRLTDMV